MSKIKIAFQGEKGAYSHIACEEIYEGAEIKNCATFEETFKMAFEDENFKAKSDFTTKEASIKIIKPDWIN